MLESQKGFHPIVMQDWRCKNLWQMIVSIINDIQLYSISLSQISIDQRKKPWYWQLEKEQTFQSFWQKPLKRHVNYLLVFKPPKSWIYISFRKLFLWSYFPVHFVNKDIEVITEQIQNHRYFTKCVRGKKKEEKI